MKPNAPYLHLPDPHYLRLLCRAAGLTPRKAAKALGIGERVMRYYLTPVAEEADYREAPYPVQFALEHLAYGEPCIEPAVDLPALAIERFEPLAYVLGRLEGEPQDRPGPLKKRIQADLIAKAPYAWVGHSLLARLQDGGYITAECVSWFKLHLLVTSWLEPKEASGEAEPPRRRRIIRPRTGV